MSQAVDTLRAVLHVRSFRHITQLLGIILLITAIMSCSHRFDALHLSGTVNSKQKTESRVADAAQPLIDINRASVVEIEKLPGIGSTLAQRIVEHRERYGRFRRVEHIIMVRGFSEQRFKEVRHLIEAKP